MFHVATANRESVERIVHENVDKSARLHTDEALSIRALVTSLQRMNA